MRDVMKALANSLGTALDSLLVKSDANLKDLIEELGRLRDNVVKAKTSQEKLDLIRAKAKELKDKYFQSKQEGKPEEDLNQLAFDFAQEEKREQVAAQEAATIVQATTTSSQQVDALLGPLQATPEADLSPQTKETLRDANASSAEAKQVCSEITQLINDAMRWTNEVDRELAEARAAVANTMDPLDLLLGPSKEDVKRTREKLDQDFDSLFGPSK